MKHHRTTYITALGVIASLLLALLPTAREAPSMAFANEPTQPPAGTVQIDQEFATVSAAAGVDARALPAAEADVLSVLGEGETLRVAGRSYDDDAQIEWVALETAPDSAAWVKASDLAFAYESATAPAMTAAPTADILNLDEEIVYLDNVGRIKVLDVEQAGDQRVTWQSPDTGFVDLALGDFNNDGDDEVVGIKGSGAAGELVVYDPVLNSTTIPAANAGSTEIPWAELHRRTIGFTPRFVAAGELDQNIPGDEIIYGYETGAASSEIIVIKADSLTPDGTGWLTHIPSDGRRGVSFSNIWSAITLANLNNSGTDEVVLVDTGATTNLSVFVVDNGGLDAGVAVVGRRSSDRLWRGTTAGNIYGDGTPRLVSFRKATGINFGATTAFIMRFTGSDLDEDEGDAEVLNPQPYFAFTADINGAVNGVRDDELFYLRNVSNNPPGIRLIARNRGNDQIDVDKTELSLDADNRWKVGVGVDVDGNAVDEIAIMQAGGIRIYRYEASGDKFLKLYRNDEAVPTNAGTIRAGNLDAIGFRAGASIDFELSSLGNSVPAGEQSTFLVKLTTSSAQAVQYQALPLSQPSWVSNFGPKSGVIDPVNGANLSVGVDSSGLAPGTYSFNAQITTSSGDIVNSPLIIPIEVEVIPALLQVAPASVSFVYQDCAPPLNLEPITKTLFVDGTLGVGFTATLADVPSVVAAQQSLSGNLSAKLDDSGQVQLHDGWGNAASIQAFGNALSAAQVGQAGMGAAPQDVPWLDVTPESGLVADEIDITISPSALPTTTIAAEALLILIGDRSTGNRPDNVRFVPINFLCASADVMLPLVTRAE